MFFWLMLGFALFCLCFNEGQGAQQCANDLFKKFETDDLIEKLDEADSEFSAFCSLWGFRNILYTPDYSAVDLGEEFVEDEIEKIEEFEEKLREYVSLGGNPELVEEVDELDGYLEKIAYLASCDLLDEQEKYMSDDYDYDEMVSAIEKAQEEEQEMEDKIELFTLLGGDPNLILDTDEIDDYLDKIEYLCDNGLLHRQEEFLQFDYDDMVEMIEEEADDDEE